MEEIESRPTIRIQAYNLHQTHDSKRLAEQVPRLKIAIEKSENIDLSSVELVGISNIRELINRKEWSGNV